MEDTIREARVVYTGQPCKLRMAGAADVSAFIRKKIGNSAREHFYGIWLDARNRPLASDLISIGSATAALVHPAQVFQGALIAGAISIILVHNHPSGDDTPSTEDREITKRLRDCGELLGVRLLDHVIIGRKTYFSFAEAGELHD